MAEVAVRGPAQRSCPQTAARETAAAVAGLLTSVNRDVT
jgi:hypothetical protein